jgi:opacity protein-like surface antigen
LLILKKQKTGLPLTFHHKFFKTSMKKAFLLLALVATLSTFAQAQALSDTTQTRKPRAGNFTTELTLSLFGYPNFSYYNWGYYGGYQNGIFSLNNILSQIRGRYFFRDNKAFRLSFNYEHHSNAKASVNNYNSDRSGNILSINPGLEKHFKGTSKLSPYIGTEIGFATGRYHQAFTSSFSPDEIEVQKGWYNHPGSSDFTEGSLGARNFNAIGLRGIAGLDYYVMKRFYLGLEFGYYVSYSKYKDVKITQKEPAREVTLKGYSAWDSGAYANSGIRAGFVF